MPVFRDRFPTLQEEQGYVSTVPLSLAAGGPKPSVDDPTGDWQDEGVYIGNGPVLPPPVVIARLTALRSPAFFARLPGSYVPGQGVTDIPPSLSAPAAPAPANIPLPSMPAATAPGSPAIPPAAAPGAVAATPDVPSVPDNGAGGSGGGLGICLPVGAPAGLRRALALRRNCDVVAPGGDNTTIVRTIQAIRRVLGPRTQTRQTNSGGCDGCGCR